MNLNNLISQIEKHPMYKKSGMVLMHHGIVRETSRSGEKVSGLRISVDHEILEKIISEQKEREGIFEILVEIAENKDLQVGDSVMYILVLGTIRDIVVPVLSDTLNAIKEKATKKEQFFI